MFDLIGNVDIVTGGNIINVGSMMSLFGAAFAPDNIQVNAILPGWIDTELTRETRKVVAGQHERVPARRFRSMVGTHH